VTRTRLATAAPDWAQVYDEQWPRVLGFFRYRLGETPDLEELTARTFEKAWPSRHEYEHDADGFTTWLLTIARYVALDHLYARTAPHAVMQPDADGREVRLKRLSPRERELIAFKYGAGLTKPAIARATGVSERSVAAILQRAVEALASAGWMDVNVNVTLRS